MLDLHKETLVSLADAAAKLPPMRRGRPVTISCLYRWITEGVQLPSGSVVRLDGLRLGGRWLTSLEALQRFAEAQTPGAAGKAVVRAS